MTMNDTTSRQCHACGGPLLELGTLGGTRHFRCRNCGWMTSLVARMHRMLRKATKAAGSF
ncbi:MAG: hypothetical protein FWG52_10335 [Proteobacteria bacterium]|nr:hypothetical protein [Pseudomonadota bacterium]MCL2590581.1 hypothetical protein [Betaproteobacteria bacterium]